MNARNSLLIQVITCSYRFSFEGPTLITEKFWDGGSLQLKNAAIHNIIIVAVHTKILVKTNSLM
jgi:hypothetical protein